jgi:hypothetical protein
MDRSGRARTCFCTALALLVALVLTACGGGGAGSSPGTERSATTVASHPTVDASGSHPSRSAAPAGSARLIDAADTICRRLNAEIGSRKKLSLQDIVGVAPRNEAHEQRAVRELDKLTPPPVLARQWRRFLAYRRTLAQQLGMLAADGKRFDTHAIERVIAAKKRAHGVLRTAATRMGLGDCAHIG